MSNITIIMYHYVRNLKNSKYPNIKGLDISLFKEQINYIRKNYYVITMEELIYSIENSSELPDKSLLLTFDDGYSDHFLNVLPILDNYKLQGSFFTPSKAILEHTVLDVNKIHFILAASKNVLALLKDLKNLLEYYRKDFNLQDFDFYFKKLAFATRIDTKEVIFIKRLLQVELIQELREKIVDILFVKYTGMSENDFSRELYMSQAQLRNLLSCGMHVGNHGHNHFWWNQLTEKEMEHELHLSCDFLRKLGVNMSNWTACYPYGAYDNQSIRMLKEKGCKLALTTEVNIANTKKINRYIMPRLDTNDLPKNSSQNPNKYFDLA